MASEPVLLVWEDAHSPDSTISLNGGGGGLDHLHSPLIITTAGWVLRDDERGVTIAGESCGDGDYRGITFVPRALVKAVQPFTGRAKRRPRVKPAPKESVDAKF